MMAEEVEKTINHFGHPHHPLKLYKKYLTWSYNSLCYVCATSPSSVQGPIYRCTECEFFIHLSCATKFPQRLCHPFHPQHFLSLTNSLESENNERLRCNACGSSCYGSAYYCHDCKFSLDLECVQWQPSKISESAQLQKNHEHPLYVIEKPTGTFWHWCSNCRTGFREKSLIYICVDCTLLLHESCVFRAEILHPFHLDHPLALVRQTYSSRHICSACSAKSFTAYHCSKCKFSLDLSCVNLEPTSRNSEHHPLSLGHPHQLTECNNIEKSKLLCSGCNRTIEDLIYVCLTCGSLLDKLCAQLLPKITHPFHQFHPLKLVHRKHEQIYTVRKGSPYAYNEDDFITCHGCESKIRGHLIYGCSKCNFHLDMLCAATEPLATIKSRIHEHSIALLTTKFDKDYYPKCHTCHRDCKGHFFRCFGCYEFNIHLKCYPFLPQVIKHDSHCDPLTLTRSQIKVESDEDSDEEFYCHACEELRDLEDPTYYCHDCLFVAHIHCVLPLIIQALEAESSEFVSAPSEASSEPFQSLLPTVNEPSPSMPSFSPTESLPLSSHASQLALSTESLPSSSQASSKSPLSSHEPSPCTLCLNTLRQMLLDCMNGCLGKHNS